MEIDARWIWRIVACLGVWGCTSLARLSIDGYLRHRATGDQAGFALGMAFLVFGFVPTTSIALVLGTAPGAAPAGRTGLTGWLARLAVAGALVAGAAFFLWFPGYVRAMVAQDRPAGPAEPEGWSMGSASAGVLIAFAAYQAACATAILWPRAARSGWFTAILLAVGAMAAAAVVTAMAQSGPGAAILVIPWAGWALAVAWVRRASRHSVAKETPAV